MGNSRSNMFGMPWGEWNNLAGLTDPYTALSAEQGVPKVLSSLEEAAENPRSGMPDPSRQTGKQKRLNLVVNRVRASKKSKGHPGLVAFAKKAMDEDNVQSAVEAVADFIGARYEDLIREFIEAGGDTYSEFHECLDVAHGDLTEEIVDEFLWEEWLVVKGLTLETFEQLVDTAAVTEDEDEIASILALRGMFEADKKKGFTGSSSSTGGVSMKGFKSLAGGMARGRGTIDWGKYGGKKKFTSVAAAEPKKPPAAAGTNEDVLHEDEDVLWEIYLREHDISVEQFHALIDEAIANGDKKAMATYLAVEEGLKTWIAKRKEAKAAKFDLSAVRRGGEIIRKVGVKNVKAANVVGQATHASSGRGR